MIPCLNIVGVATRVKIPSLSRFVVAMLRVWRAWVRSEEIAAPQWVAEDRRRRCHLQDGVCYLKEVDQCLECSCFVKLKSLLATEDCPRKLW